MKNNFYALSFFMTIFFFSCDAFLKKNNVDNSAPSNPDSINSSINPFDSNFIEPRNAEYSKINFISNIGLNIIIPNIENYNLELKMFKLNLKQAINSNKLSKEHLKSQWKDLITAFHLVESQSFGPILSKDTATQLDIKSQLYSWPYSNNCLADKFIFNKRFSTGPQVAGSQATDSEIKMPFNSKTLDTVEYLLFSDTDQVQCNLKANPYFSKWLELPTNEKNKDRFELALNLLNSLEILSEKLLQDWNRNNKNYTKNLLDRTQFPNIKDPINMIFQALYSLETVKDKRLGLPLGLNKECGKPYCPEKIEHFNSDLGLIVIESRLKGFKQLFFGGEINGVNHHGFDDMLAQADHASISDKMKNLILAAENNLAQVLISQDSFKIQLDNFDHENCKLSTSENRLVPLCSLHADIRKITSLLKSEVLIVLSLDAPPVYQGDND